MAGKMDLVLTMALDLYNDKMSLSDEILMSPEELSKNHQSALEKVMLIFERMSKEEEDEVKVEFSQKLKKIIQLQYDEMKRKMWKTHEDLKTLDNGLIDIILASCHQEVTSQLDSLSLDINRLDKMKIQRSAEEKAVREFKKSSRTIEYPEIFGELESGLVQRVKGISEELCGKFENQVKEMERNEMELFDRGIENYRQNVDRKIKGEILETGNILREILSVELEREIRNYQEQLPLSLASSSFRETSLRKKLNQLADSFVHSNELKVKSAEGNLNLIIQSSIENYHKEIQKERSSIPRPTPAQFQTSHAQAEAGSLNIFQKLCAQNKIPEFLLTHTKTSGLKESLNKLKKKNWQEIQNFVNQQEECTVVKYEEKYLSKFEKRSRLYIQLYHLIQFKNYKENTDDILDSVMSSLRSKLELDIDTSESDDLKVKVEVRVRGALEKRQKELWDEIEERNKTFKSKLQKQMSKLRGQYVEKFTGGGKFSGGHRLLYEEKDDIVDELSSSFQCSNELEKERLVQGFSREIQSCLVKIQGEEEVETSPIFQVSTSSSLDQEKVYNNRKSDSPSTSKIFEKTKVELRTPFVKDKEKTVTSVKEKTNYSFRFEDEEEEEESMDLNSIIEKCCGFYRAAMLRHFSRPVYYNPNRLAGLHHSCAKEALGKLPKGSWDSKDKSRIFSEGLDKEFVLFEEKNNMNAPTSYSIGIDLGTTYSCCSVYMKDKVEVIPNSQGKWTTPSYVSFPSPQTSLVGDEAKTQAAYYPEKTVYEVKRLIGRNFDKIKQEDLDKWPFRIVEERKIPKILIDGRTYHPEEISGKILLEMKRTAEAYLKQKVTSCVITVPAYFNDGQRQATKNAGEAAGLEVLRIINEPTAAAIAAYRMNWIDNLKTATPGHKRTGLVFDMGGGTFDVCLYSASHDKVNILKVDGDTHLGGVDFDNEIVSYCVAEFNRVHHVDLLAGKGSLNLRDKSNASRKLMRLKGVAEQCKKQLSIAESTTIQIDSIHEDIDLKVSLTRSKFVGLIEPYLKRALDCVKNVLKDVEMGKENIDEILLVGGSTRIPDLRRKLKDFFGKELNTLVDPDLSVAIGAGYEAAVLNGKRAMERGDIRTAALAPQGMSIMDVTPMSLGIGVNNGENFYCLIPRNSQVPTECSKNFATTYNNQTSVQIVIYEGEEPKVKANHEVGQFFMNGIPSDLAGVQTVKVTMRVSEEGIIDVIATSNGNGVEKSLEIRDYKKRLSSKDIALLKEEVGQREQDEEGSSSSGGHVGQVPRAPVTRRCRFCKELVQNCASIPVALGGTGVVCEDPDCQQYSGMACRKMLSCDHVCGGVKGEPECLPCLRGCEGKETLKQNIENECVICLTSLAGAPSIQLACGHVFHYHCTVSLLQNRWMGPRITFSFSSCPACKVDIEHPLLENLLEPIRVLREDVQKKSLLRLKHEGLENCEEITNPGNEFHGNPTSYAMKKYAYYECFKCTKAYFGGEAVCGDGGGGGDGFNPAELVCGGCSDVARIQNCPKHGVEYIEFKCRFCCSPAIYFCHGTTHYCNVCHSNPGRVTGMPVNQLPRCPAGPNGVQLNGDCPLNMAHPPAGHEFPLGCGLCRNLKNLNF